MHEHVHRRLHGSCVPAAHREEAEAHAHVEPLADPAAPGQSRVLLVPLRTSSCTGDTMTLQTQAETDLEGQRFPATLSENHRPDRYIIKYMYNLSLLIFDN